MGGPATKAELTNTGFVHGHLTNSGIWRHPGAQLPAIVPGNAVVVGLRVDDVAAFAHAQGSSLPLEGSALSGLRKVVISQHGDAVEISGVERRSWACGISPQTLTDPELLSALKAWDLWDSRPRSSENGSAVVQPVVNIARQMVQLVGADLAASYVLELERQYWQSRNTTAVLQHSRQNRLGLGWGNNDHHTFRSSRPAFKALIEVFNTLGFASRERFYAGDQAGWGAQVLDHPGCGGVLFCDVDLKPEEVNIDFAHSQLAEGEKLGTIGLWCALHGESILSA